MKIRQSFKPYLFFLFLLLIQSKVIAQVGIGTTDLEAGTSLHIEGDNAGVLINRVTLSGTDDVTTIPSLGATQEGLLVYNTNISNNIDPTTNVGSSFYYWTGDEWETIKQSGAKETGWVVLTDGNTLETIPGVSSADITNNIGWQTINLNFEDDASDNIIDAYAPGGLTGVNFFDSTNSRLTPIKLGDAVMLRLQFDAIPDDNNAYVLVRINIGTPSSPIIIYQKTIPLLRGAGEVNNISESILLYQLATFLSNGAGIEIAYSTTGGNPNDIDVFNFGLLINRLSSK
ncbi:MAG: hypothetical protein ACSHW7_11855 [Patiriisocius sp.]|uniref:hypothetical protein n=1 Tax=Patiriisocius sp. TaxID=2822396 RepID=UPI003EF8A163